MATSLELGGAEKPDYVQFTSLLPKIKDASAPGYDAIYGAYLEGQRAVTLGNHKLILYPRAKKVLLFDLEKDPQEMVDLSDKPESQPVIRKLYARLLDLQKETGDALDLSVAFGELHASIR